MEMILNQKERMVIQIRAQVDQIHDLLGLRIDEGIKETIVYLWALGFKTSGSCEEHLSHGMGGPWIEIGERMPKREGLLFETNIREKILLQTAKLLQKVSIILDRFYKGTEIHFFIPCTKEMKKGTRLSKEKNLRIQLRLMQLIEEFYKDRVVSIDVKLIMDGAMGRLISQGARFHEIRSKKERIEKLKQYQGEMKVLTMFLKKKYFEN